MNMTCPACGAISTSVIDSRPTSDGNVIRRRRRCAACDHRFSTYEVQAAVFADTLARRKEVSAVRQSLIDDFAATLPKIPRPRLLNLRPR